MKNDYRPHNKSVITAKNVFSVFVAILIIAVSVPIVSATGTNGIAFSELPTSGYDGSQIEQNGIVIGTTTEGNYTGNLYITNQTGSPPSYVFAVGTTIYGITTQYASEHYLFLKCGSIFWSRYNWSQSSRYSELYVQTVRNNVTNIQNIPTYDTYEDGLDDFMNQSDPGDEGKPLNYTLPAGNIAYLEIDSSLFNGVNLGTIMNRKSALGSGEPWSESSQFYAMTDNMLSNGASVYDLNGTKIVWNKSPNASTNILGQTDYAIWESQGPYPNKTYFVICNPYYNHFEENNTSVTIVANGIINVYVQPLKTVLQQDGNVTTFVTTVDGGTYDGVVTDDLGPIEWTDPDGGSTAPGTSTSNTPVTGTNQFQQWLQGILQQIISVFEPAHDAITTLASAVQNFSGWLKALYIWLPSPVLNLLTSAISLAIIIGVIKVFI